MAMTPDEAYTRKLRLTEQLNRIDLAMDEAEAEAGIVRTEAEKAPVDASQPKQGALVWKWEGERHVEVKIGGKWEPAEAATERTRAGIKECDEVLSEAGWF